MFEQNLLCVCVCVGSMIPNCYTKLIKMWGDKSVAACRCEFCRVNPEMFKIPKAVDIHSSVLGQGLSYLQK